MSIETLEKTKTQITTLEDELKLLRKKQKELRSLREKYYADYFDTHREEYARLTDIPKNPFSYSKPHVLYEYSALNVDSVGRMIRELIKKYENKDYVAKRLTLHSSSENAFGRYPIQVPIFVVGPEKEFHRFEDGSHNIVINYDWSEPMKEFPTNNPVTWDIHEYSDPFLGTNYNHLIDYHDGLSFNYKYKGYIEELIFSLAYYQKEHDIKQMTLTETRKVYQKIFRS